MQQALAFRFGPTAQTPNGFDAFGTHFAEIHISRTGSLKSASFMETTSETRLQHQVGHESTEASCVGLFSMTTLTMVAQFSVEMSRLWSVCLTATLSMDCTLQKQVRGLFKGPLAASFTTTPAMVAGTVTAAELLNSQSKTATSSKMAAMVSTPTEQADELER